MQLTRLDRQGLTASSRLMLVVYPVFYLLFGLFYVLGGDQRFLSPSYDVALSLASMKVWGTGFLAISGGLTCAWVVGQRGVMIVALCVGVSASAMWTFVFGCSLFDTYVPPSLDPESSFGAPILWGFVTFAHIASLRSLTKDKVLVA